MKLKNECEGCLSYSRDLMCGCEINSTPYKSETEHCPCLTCLIKGMCREECEDLTRYHKLLSIGVRDEK